MQISGGYSTLLVIKKIITEPCGFTNICLISTSITVFKKIKEWFENTLWVLHLKTKFASDIRSLFPHSTKTQLVLISFILESKINALTSKQLNQLMFGPREIVFWTIFFFLWKVLKYKVSNFSLISNKFWFLVNHNKPQYENYRTKNSTTGKYSSISASE